MSGRLAAVYPSAATPTTLYTVPAGMFASITVRACNQTQAKIAVSVQLCNGPPAREDYIEHEAPLHQHCPLEDSGIVLRDGQSVVVTTATEGISFVCWGIEEDL